LGLRLAEVWAYPVARIANLSPGMPGLHCDCIFSFSSSFWGAGMGLEIFAAFLCCLCFYVLFCCPALYFMIPNALLGFLSSEYGLYCIT
jgi:hypothetical protein